MNSDPAAESFFPGAARPQQRSASAPGTARPQPRGASAPGVGVCTPRGDHQAPLVATRAPREGVLHPARGDQPKSEPFHPHAGQTPHDHRPTEPRSTPTTMNPAGQVQPTEPRSAPTTGCNPPPPPGVQCPRAVRTCLRATRGPPYQRGVWASECGEGSPPKTRKGPAMISDPPTALVDAVPTAHHRRDRHRASTVLLLDYTADVVAVAQPADTTVSARDIQPAAGSAGHPPSARSTALPLSCHRSAV